MVKSWRTSSTAIVSAIATVAGAIYVMIDGNPETNPDWQIVVPVVLGLFGIGMQARDNVVTSRQAGAE